MQRPPGELRIIAGVWRSRRVVFDAAAGVRPTPDRVRQTLFDWLQSRIEGATCLDLFAGSGALGLEALSRGAGQVTFVETGRVQAELVRQALEKLRSSDAEVLLEDGIAHLQRTLSRYEIAFLDPPYDSRLLDQALIALPRVLKPENRIYLEWPAGKPPVLPAGYVLLREKQAGRVSYGLATYTGT